MEKIPLFYEDWLQLVNFHIPLHRHVTLYAFHLYWGLEHFETNALIGSVFETYQAAPTSPVWSHWCRTAQVEKSVYPEEWRTMRLHWAACFELQTLHKWLHSLSPLTNSTSSNTPPKKPFEVQIGFTDPPRLYFTYQDSHLEVPLFPPQTVLEIVNQLPGSSHAFLPRVMFTPELRTAKRREKLPCVLDYAPLVPLSDRPYHQALINLKYRTSVLNAYLGSCTHASAEFSLPELQRTLRSCRQYSDLSEWAIHFEKKCIQIQIPHEPECDASGTLVAPQCRLSYTLTPQTSLTYAHGWGQNEEKCPTPSTPASYLLDTTLLGTMLNGMSTGAAAHPKVRMYYMDPSSAGNEEEENEKVAAATSLSSLSSSSPLCTGLPFCFPTHILLETLSSGGRDATPPSSSEEEKSPTPFRRQVYTTLFQRGTATVLPDLHPSSTYTPF